MNDIVKSAPAGLPSTADFKAGLQRARSVAPTDGVFMKMDHKTGMWTFGGEHEVAEKNSLWAVNPLTIQHGHMCMIEVTNGYEMLGEVYETVVQPLPARPVDINRVDCNGKPAQWQQAYRCDLVCVEGEQEGVQASFGGSSKGQAKAFSQLIGELIRQIDVDENAIVPIVELDSSSYTHKKYGTIHSPVLNVTDWSTMGVLTYDAPEGETAGDEIDDGEPNGAEADGPYEADGSDQSEIIEGEAQPQDEPEPQQEPEQPQAQTRTRTRTRGNTATKPAATEAPAEATKTRTRPRRTR